MSTLRFVHFHLILALFGTLMVTVRVEAVFTWIKQPTNLTVLERQANLFIPCSFSGADPGVLPFWQINGREFGVSRLPVLHYWNGMGLQITYAHPTFTMSMYTCIVRLPLTGERHVSTTGYLTVLNQTDYERRFPKLSPDVTTQNFATATSEIILMTQTWSQQKTTSPLYHESRLPTSTPTDWQYTVTPKFNTGITVFQTTIIIVAAVLMILTTGIFTLAGLFGFKRKKQLVPHITHIKGARMNPPTTDVDNDEPEYAQIVPTKTVNWDMHKNEAYISYCQ